MSVLKIRNPKDSKNPIFVGFNPSRISEEVNSTFNLSLLTISEDKKSKIETKQKENLFKLMLLEYLYIKYEKDVREAWKIRK